MTTRAVVFKHRKGSGSAASRTPPRAHARTCRRCTEYSPLEAPPAESAPCAPSTPLNVINTSTTNTVAPAQRGSRPSLDRRAAAGELCTPSELAVPVACRRILAAGCALRRARLKESARRTADAPRHCAQRLCELECARSVRVHISGARARVFSRLCSAAGRPEPTHRAVRVESQTRRATATLPAADGLRAIGTHQTLHVRLARSTNRHQRGQRTWRIRSGVRQLRRVAGHRGTGTGVGVSSHVKP